MLLLTSRQFPSGDTVGVLVAPRKLSRATPMGRAAGPLNQPGSSWIC
ncbi:ribosomal protein L17c [Zea mays]|uniref:Ribosomal protein L17c n=1 Tax=Zea mays TaxID=4577 RepID=C4J8I8_MAIZE|nr:unknown [Zea mays]ONM03206.1 ribosomal protein L17c [Zea mays]